MTTRMGQRIARGTIALLLVAPPLWAQQREVWVVNEASREIAIVDSPTDVPATIETISLGSAADPKPYGIAFSTFAATPGSHAFVSQGDEIRVIDFATRGLLPDVDVATLIGSHAAVLRGLDAARPDRFSDPSGTTALRYYLHVAADVQPAVGDPFEPWFIVLDQESLAGLVARPALVSAGPLISKAPAGLQAMEVRVLGSRSGDRLQRAWYSYRKTTGPQAIGAVLVSAREVLGLPFLVDRSTETVLGAGESAPASVHPGAPHSRELPLLPEGPSGTLRALDGGRRCAVAGTPRAVSVTGPGLASFDIWVAALDAAGTDTLQLGNWETCAFAPAFAGGENPVDLDTLGRVEWQELYVANHDSDNITIVTETDPDQPIFVELSLAASPPCTKCPRSLAVRESPATVCRAVDLTADPDLGDVLYRWDGVGCEELTEFKFWCRCLSQNLDDCPADCVQNCAPTTPDKQTGEIWCEVDVVGSEGGDDGGEKTVGGGGSKGTQSHPEPNDK